MLSPLLYSLFVDNLLLELTASGYGAFIDGLYCDALIYADDLVLIAASQSDLQALLDITAAYATRWHYTFNAAKSFVLVFGQSTRSHSSLRAQRHWSLGSQVITECDEIKHWESCVLFIPHLWSGLWIVVQLVEVHFILSFALLLVQVEFILWYLIVSILPSVFLFFFMVVSSGIFLLDSFCSLSVPTERSCVLLWVSLFAAVCLLFLGF